MARHHSQVRNNPWTMFFTGSLATKKWTAAPFHSQDRAQQFLSPQAAAFRDGFLRSPAPSAGARSRAAGGHSRRPNPCRQAGSPPAYWSAAAVLPGHRRYTDEFKRAAVGLAASSGRPLSQIAEELGIPVARLRPWRNRNGDAMLPSDTFLLPQELSKGSMVSEEGHFGGTSPDWRPNKNFPTRYYLNLNSIRCAI